VLYVLEANPRASRTVPFVSKATAVPLAKAAARVMLGASIAELRAEGLLPGQGDGGSLPPSAPIAVKEAVMPFNRFRTIDGRSVDTVLGPEMRSTGEVMGIDAGFGIAFAKAQAGAFGPLPTTGRVFVSMANRDKRHMIFPVKRLADLGFEILATSGTAAVLRRNGVAATVVPKLSERAERGQTDDDTPEQDDLLPAAGEPDVEGQPRGSSIVALIRNGQVGLVVNTPHGTTAGGSPRLDGYAIRSAAVARNVPCITTVQGLAAAVQGIEALLAGEVGVRSLQDWATSVRGDLAVDAWTGS
jgi:carbamoyl-phosphate synthase large subunit